MLLLFNAFGYYLLFGYEQKAAHQKFVQSVQNLPNTAFNIVKFKVSAYVNIEDRDFEYVEGSYVSEGKTFNFIKKRIHNDSLELYCINNVGQDLLNAKFNQYVQENIIDTDDDNVPPAKLTFKSFLKEYIPHTPLVVYFSSKTQDTEGGDNFASIQTPLNLLFLSPITPPPNVA